MQKTLKSAVRFEGIGVHSGAPVIMEILPALESAGITFLRTDIPDAQPIHALYDQVFDTQLSTRIGNEALYVSTIEHIMAAFAGLGITNAAVRLDGPEVPIMDGSSYIFAKVMFDVGVVEQSADARVFEVVKPLRVYNDKGAYAEFLPDAEFVIDFEIDFEAKAIGKQSKSLVMANGMFLRELADCRTFCMQKDVDGLREKGLALGGSVENAVVFDENGIRNAEGLRRADEPLRHKMLDALGDLHLAGGFIIGKYRGYKSGHGLTNKLLREAFTKGVLVENKKLAQNVSSFPGAEIIAQDFLSI